jgi:BON domain
MVSIPRFIGAVSSVCLMLMMLSGCQPTTGQTIGHQTAASTRSGASISNEVQTKLMGAHRSGFPNIDVDSVRDGVKLSGVVETEAQRDRAEWVARQVDGVVEVDNRVQVRARPLTGRYNNAPHVDDTQTPSLPLLTYGGLIIQGDVVRIESGRYVVKEKDGKEVRLEIDQTTKMGQIKKGDHIVATVDEEKNVLSIHSVP